MAAGFTWKSAAICGRAMTTRKKSKASSAQPRKPAATAKDASRPVAGEGPA